MRVASSALIVLILLLAPRSGTARQGTGLDEQILKKGEQLLEEAKTAYEAARSSSSVAGFVDAGFKLEEARIKFVVLQEIGSPERQKLATDRLRAVNQLAKLIHDGRVAISGVPAGPAEPKPGMPEKPSDAPPTAAPPVPAVDVTRRHPVPDAARQKEAEKLIRDLFRDDYARKGADRQQLGRTLLEQAGRTSGDPAALWVLYRESLEVATQTGDVRTAVAVVDAVARVFDVDALAMKSTALAAAGKAAKAPADNGLVGALLLGLIDDLVAADHYDAAEKSAASALLFARKSNDPALVKRATIRAKEVSEAKARFAAMKGILETLAKSPDDPAANLEMGQFLCFMKGSWELGLRFLSKSSDAGLKALAEKELALPIQAADQVAVGDGWWDLAEKEKNAGRKERMLDRARSWYLSAQPQTSGLLRLKLDKRLEGYEAPPGGTVDLLRIINPNQDSVNGEWILEGQKLVSNSLDPAARLQIPYQPPEEYDLTVVCERREGGDAFGVGLANPSFQSVMIFDGYSNVGGAAGFEVLDGRLADANDSTRKGLLFTNLKASTIVCSVRKTGIKVTVDGRTIVDWKGDLGRLTLRADYAVPNRRSLMLATWSSKYAISKLQLTAVTGQGKFVR